MAADSYLMQRCGLCGETWRDKDGKVIHPDKYCIRYLPDPPAELPLSVLANMPHFDPRQLQRNPADTARDSPSFKIPRPDPAVTVQAFGVPINLSELDS